MEYSGKIVWENRLLLVKRKGAIWEMSGKCRGHVGEMSGVSLVKSCMNPTRFCLNLHPGKAVLPLLKQKVPDDAEVV